MNTRLLTVVATLATAVVVGVVAFDRPSRTEPVCPTAVIAAETGLMRAASTPTATPSFRAAGLMINAPVHTGVDPSAGDSGDSYGVELAFFGTFSRTSLAVEYRHAAGGMLGLDSAACSLTRFTDDRGTNLKNEDATFGPFDSMPRVSDDGRHLVFVVPSDALPSRGATSVSAAGVLAVRCATNKRDFTSEPVTLTEGASFTVGGYELRIEDVGPSQWGEGYALTLESERDLEGIEAWMLVLPDGTEVEVSPSMSMSGMGAWQQTLELEGPVERASLRITSWTDMRTVEVPFEVATGLGLR